MIHIHINSNTNYFGNSFEWIRKNIPFDDWTLVYKSDPGYKPYPKDPAVNFQSNYYLWLREDSDAVQIKLMFPEQFKDCLISQL